MRLVPTAEDGSVSREAARGVEILWRHMAFPAGWLERAAASLPDLRWAHSDFVGIDGLDLEPLFERGITYTNGAGNQAPAIAEWVVLAMLAAVKQFAFFVRASDAGRWEPTPHLRELRGARALVLGYGAIGREVAARAAPLGVEIVAAVRRPKDLGPNVARTVVGEAWRDELAAADFVVLGLPLNAATRNTIDAPTLAGMKRSAWLINVARGGLVDESALLRALDDGRIAGAFLDAFVTEPLPGESGLWGRPNVTIVPHYTWQSPQTPERCIELFGEQLQRWTKCEALLNVVPPDAIAAES